MRTGPEAIATHGKTWVVLANHKEQGQPRVWIGRAKNKLAVAYGYEFHEFPLYEMDRAFREYAACLVHTFNCTGSLTEE